MDPAVAYSVLGANVLVIALYVFMEIGFRRTIRELTKSHLANIESLQREFLKRQAELEGMAFIDQRERQAYLDVSVSRLQRELNSIPPGKAKEIEEEYRKEEAEEQEMRDMASSRMSMKEWTMPGRNENA